MAASECISGVTLLMQQITLEYQAAQRGLSGIAYGTSRHDFINAKLENMSVHHEELARLVGPGEAIRLVAEVLEHA